MSHTYLLLNVDKNEPLSTNCATRETAIADFSKQLNKGLTLDPQDQSKLTPYVMLEIKDVSVSGAVQWAAQLSVYKSRKRT